MQIEFIGVRTEGGWVVTSFRVGAVTCRAWAMVLGKWVIRALSGKAPAAWGPGPIERRIYVGEIIKSLERDHGADWAPLFEEAKAHRAANPSKFPAP
jgi:hypothetical protein